MQEHTPLGLGDEVTRVMDALSTIHAFAAEALRENADPDGNATFTTEQLKSIADVLAESSVRTEDLAESVMELVRERSRQSSLDRFTREVATWPPTTYLSHDRLGNRARWYWCGDPLCPDCLKRGVIPGELDAS